MWINWKQSCSDICSSRCNDFFCLIHLVSSSKNSNKHKSSAPQKSKNHNEWKEITSLTILYIFKPVWQIGGQERKLVSTKNTFPHWPLYFPQWSTVTLRRKALCIINKGFSTVNTTHLDLLWRRILFPLCFFVSYYNVSTL